MENKLCEIHNEPALFCEIDAQQNQVFLCRFCVQQRFKIQNIDDVVNSEKKELKQLEMLFDQSIKLLKDFAEVLDYFTQQIQQKLKKFSHQVQQSLSHINEKKNQVKIISNNFTKLQLNKINEQKGIINSSLAQIIQQLNNQIKELEISSRLNQLYQSIDEKCRLNQQDDIKTVSVIERQFTQLDDSKTLYTIQKKNYYQLIQESSYKQNVGCYAIAFNKDATIMIAGCLELIKVFEFKDDKLRELQQLNGHSNSISCLGFMKKSNQFFSASFDSTIMIWEQNYNNLWQCNYILKNHRDRVLCILMNQNENLLISGSDDKTIKFCKKVNDTWKCHQSIDCYSSIYSISLNDQEYQLITSVENKQILVIQLQVKGWKIKQKIQCEQFGYRLCFISQNQFVFQSYKSQNLQIFDYVAKEETYQRGQVLQYQNYETQDYSLFPIQYLSQIGLIQVKNGNYVHIIKKNQNGQFKIEQSINFNTHHIYGTITDDGKYISTWDIQSKEIKIRKFEF